MRRIVMFAVASALAIGPAVAGPDSATPRATVSAQEVSAQSRRPPTRLRVYPPRGRLLYRDCTFHLAQEWRPSGTVIVPRQHCWWVRG